MNALAGAAAPFQTWLYPDDRGLYCAPGRFHIDPHRPVERAVVTHGHSDHARRGHGAVLATPDTAAIMRARLGPECAGAFQELAYGEALAIGEVAVRLVPAGHILGSAQVVIDWRGRRAVVSGDYKRSPDPTCAPFEPVACDLFVTEATFALPVFRHEPAAGEAAKLLRSREEQPDRAHLVGAYGLGKCQRMIRLLREAGYDRPIYLHGAMLGMCELYERRGIALGPLVHTEGERGGLAGEIVVCPPSALRERWSRRFADPVAAFASGWMRIKGRARQQGVELPLVVSDHADWPELIATIRDTGTGEVWITHGRDDALGHYLATQGIEARALALVGRDEEAE
ncbi:MAG: ligase-associated DNA damage response exonuclease [Hyphomicrobiaceae bacterium]|nr:ligase-associated DNA damage response exonuclease [Hyphomicrobiaceae bacterium]